MKQCVFPIYVHALHPDNNRWVVISSTAYSGNEGVGHCLQIRISLNQDKANLQTCTTHKSKDCAINTPANCKLHEQITLNVEPIQES